MRRFRLVAVDLDGTLLRSNGTLSERTRRALDLLEPAGSQLVIVTGRPWRWFLEVADLVDDDALVVCLNGAATVRAATGEIVVASPLGGDPARALVARLRDRHPGVRFAVETTAGFGHEEGYRQRGPSFVRPVPDLGALFDLGDVLKLLAQDPLAGAEDLRKTVLDSGIAGVTVTFSSPSLLEIGGFHATKAEALAGLAGRLGVDRAEVLAFGDMPNDVAMLAWAGHGVAVANAHPEARAAAAEVTASNDDDGVALVLERLFGDHDAL
jgi:Cof subfamily protein (haloacid dehalogenase superfamily)